MNSSTLNIIKKVLSALTILFLFLIWFSYEVSAYGYSEGMTVSGFATYGADIAPIALICILIFKRENNVQNNKLYLYAAIGGVVITFLTGLIYPQIGTSVQVSGLSQKMSWGVGLWLSLIDYIVIGAISFLEIKNSDSASDVTEGANQFIDKISSIVTKKPENTGQTNGDTANKQFCSYCGAKLKDGALFCAECGRKL